MLEHEQCWIWYGCHRFETGANHLGHFGLTGKLRSDMKPANIYKGYDVTHPCVVFTANTIEKLRKTELSGPHDLDKRVTPEVYFSAETSQAGVEITLLPQEGGLLKAEILVSGNPEWLTLNIGLGSGNFEIGDTLGIAYDLRGSDEFSVQPFIRSSYDGVEYDTALADDFRFGALPGVLLHPITAEVPLTYSAAFHTLILPLPKRNSAFEIRNLRLFHVEASSGLAASVTTLGGLAV